MKTEDYTLSAQNLFDFLCGYFGYDWDEIMRRNKISGTLGEVRVQHAMFDVYKNIQQGDGFLAWKQGISIIKNIINEDNEWKTPKDLRERALFLYDAANFLDDYKMVCEDDRQDWLEKLRSMRLLTEEEKQKGDIADICPRSMNEDVLSMFKNKRLFRICRYKGHSPLNPVAVENVSIGENFIMANNVGQIMMLGKDGQSDKLNIYVALNIDDVLDFSYFIIGINNGDNWWFVSDESEFSNPEAKTGIAQRGAFRYREDNFEKSIFPYIYLDYIQEWRKNNKQLDRKEKVKREMYTVPLKEWPVQCRVMLNLLIERLLTILMDDNGKIQQMKFGYEFVNTLLLENKNLKEGEWKNRQDKFDYADKDANANKRIENMIFKDDEIRALVPMNTEELANKISLWNGSLMTQDKFDELEAWAVCNAEYEQKNNLLKKAEINREADKIRMANMLEKNFPNRIETLFAARELSVFIYEPDMIYKSSNTFNWFREVFLMNIHLKSESNWEISEIPGVIGGELESPCKKCGKHSLKRNHTSVLKIYHYSLLAWLAGVKREKLPYWFINYEGHIFQGYTGNHLLNNINPMFRLQDGLSRRYPNGISINIRICKRCRTAMAKTAMEKGVLVINKLTCESEGLFSLQDFKEWLKDKGIDNENIASHYFLL